jgi:hypothetical protein
VSGARIGIGTGIGFGVGIGKKTGSRSVVLADHATSPDHKRQAKSSGHGHRYAHDISMWTIDHTHKYVPAETGSSWRR